MRWSSLFEMTGDDNIAADTVSVVLYVQVQYVCKVIRVRINRVRLPNLLEVS